MKKSNPTADLFVANTIERMTGLDAAPMRVMRCPACDTPLAQVAGKPGLWYCPSCPEDDGAIY